MKLEDQIYFITGMIRENRIEHHRLKKELNELLEEFQNGN
jgi:hypothetical protein